MKKSKYVIRTTIPKKYRKNPKRRAKHNKRFSRITKFFYRPVEFSWTERYARPIRDFANEWIAIMEAPTAIERIFTPDLPDIGDPLLGD